MEKGSLIWIGIGALALLVLLTSPCDARSELPRSGSFLSFFFIFGHIRLLGKHVAARTPHTIARSSSSSEQNITWDVAPNKLFGLGPPEELLMMRVVVC